MDLIEILIQNSDEIVKESCRLANRAKLIHYRESGSQVLELRLKTLLELTVQAVKDRHISAMVEHAEKIARERFVSGYDLCEVQTAFNSLEEVLWKRIISQLPPEEIGEALGLVSTALGGGKDAFACQYVGLARGSKINSGIPSAEKNASQAPLENWW